MPDELNERLNNQIEIEEAEIIPEPLNQIVFRIDSDIDIFLYFKTLIFSYILRCLQHFNRYSSGDKYLKLLEFLKAKMNANSFHTIQQRFILKN